MYGGSAAKGDTTRWLHDVETDVDQMRGLSYWVDHNQIDQIDPKLRVLVSNSRRPPLSWSVS